MRAILQCTACLLVAASGAVSAVAPLHVETLAEGLDKPFAVMPLPGGEVLVTEKPGRLVSIRERGRAAAVAGIPRVLWEGEYAGLQDMALHPRFSENRFLYISYVHGHRDANAVRIARGRYEAGRLSDVEVIFTVSPTKATLNHPGARLAFMKDETLLMTVGDGYQYREAAQDPNSMLGKVVRITDDGRLPADNPLEDESGRPTAVWTLGHRHPQGLLRDPVTNRVYVHEHGAKGGDELNVIERGKNYGWPLATHGVSYSGAYISPYHVYPGTERPLVHWTPSLAPCGITQCRSCQWPEWEGDLFIGMLGGKQVRRIRLRDGTAPEQEALLADMGARVRDVRFGLDGALYVLHDETGKLLRISRRP
jgi:glucose/arabinose dehydrogenase